MRQRAWAAGMMIAIGRKWVFKKNFFFWWAFYIHVFAHYVCVSLDSLRTSSPSIPCIQVSRSFVSNVLSPALAFASSVNGLSAWLARLLLLLLLFVRDNSQESEPSSSPACHLRGLRPKRLPSRAPNGITVALRKCRAVVMYVQCGMDKELSSVGSMAVGGKRTTIDEGGETLPLFEPCCQARMRGRKKEKKGNWVDRRRTTQLARGNIQLLLLADVWKWGKERGKLSTKCPLKAALPTHEVALTLQYASTSCTFPLTGPEVLPPRLLLLHTQPEGQEVGKP